MMQAVVYDGNFEGFLCAVFDVYEYKLKDVNIVIEDRHQPSMFSSPHKVHYNSRHSERVWKGLQNKLSPGALEQVYRTFLSELEGIENVLLRYIQYAFSSKSSMEQDYGNPDVLMVVQTAKKVWREKHRMEAFVRFQKTADDLYYAVIEPDFNVLPLLEKHFKTRYADQQWMIYDAKRKYGLHYDLNGVSNVQITFAENNSHVRSASIYDESEEIYQRLWQQYFKSVNIAARKNTKLHIQHMPKRYWKYLTEKTALS